MRTALQILGMALLVIGGQGAVRLLVDGDDAGLVGWVPGGTAAHLAADVALIVAGAVLAARATRER